MNSYVQGKTVRVTVLFKTSGGTPYDPDKITFRLKTAKSESTHAYPGGDGRVTKTGTGAYLFKAKPPPGAVAYRWIGEGPTDDDAIEGAFTVTASAFASG